MLAAALAAGLPRSPLRAAAAALAALAALARAQEPLQALVGAELRFLDSRGGAVVLGLVHRLALNHNTLSPRILTSITRC